MDIVIFSKTTPVCDRIIDHTLKYFPKTDIFKGERGDVFPNIAIKYDFMISFLSPWIIPKEILLKAKVAINFHPAPLEYPGTGCYNFAIYDKVKTYGVTCHHMLAKVDTGSIVAVKHFPIENETVLSLKEKTMKVMEELYYHIFDYIINEKNLPSSYERWKRKPYTRKDLQELCKITCDMNSDEIKKRVLATYFPNAIDNPYIELNGMKFFYKP